MAQAKTGHRRKALIGVGALRSLKDQITSPSIQLVHLSRRECFRAAQMGWTVGGRGIGVVWLGLGLLLILFCNH
jgi:hypothetical protein